MTDAKRIGEKIKALRKKNDLTQERMADYLNISYQAISKWETGAGLPDISMIAPLTKLLGVTADELLGLAEEAADERKAYFDAEYVEYWQKEDHDADYEIALQAVAEYPGDFRYLEWLAATEYYTAFNDNYRNGGPFDEHFLERMESSIKHYQMIYEDCKDEKLRNSALWGLILDYKYTNRPEEARKYAELYPEGDSQDRDTALTLCLKGEELQRQYQKIIEKNFRKLCGAIGEYWWWPDGYSISDKQLREILDAEETMIRTLFPDGNFLDYSRNLELIYRSRAYLAMKEGDHESAVSALEQVKKFGIELNRILKEGKLRYTGLILNGYEKDTVQRPGDELDFWRDTVNEKCFNPLREREDFKAMLREE